MRQDGSPDSGERRTASGAAPRTSAFSRRRVPRGAHRPMGLKSFHKRKFLRPDQRETQQQAGVQPCSRGWGMRVARTRDGLLAQVPPSIVMSRSSGIALSESRADLPRTTMLMPAHLRGAKQGDGLTGRQWRGEWAKDGAKPHSPADRSTRPLEADPRKSRFTRYRMPRGPSPMCQMRPKRLRTVIYGYFWAVWRLPRQPQLMY